MTETNETSNQNELDLTNLKYYMELIDGLNLELGNSLDFLTTKDMEEIARYTKVSMALERITNLYPAMRKLLIDLQKQIDELPEYAKVANNEL